MKGLFLFLLVALRLKADVLRSGVMANGSTGVGANLPPVITTQPAPSTNYPYYGFTVSVVASGTAPLSYQWRLGGTAISGATQSSYTQNPSLVSETGLYDCVVTNLYGTNTSIQVYVSVPVDPLDSDGRNYYVAVTNNGGTIANADLTAVQTFITTMKNNGDWTFLTDCSPLAGNQTNASVVKLINHSKSQSAKVQLVNGGNYTTSTGFWLTNGAYLWPGLVLSNAIFAEGTNGACIWISSYVTNTRGWFYGGDNGVGHQQNYVRGGFLTPNYDWGGVQGGDGTLGLLNSADDLAIGEGMISQARFTTSSASLFINGRDVLDNSDNIFLAGDGANADFAWCIGARYAAAPPVSGAPGTIKDDLAVGFYAVDNGIPKSHQTNYYNAVRTLMRSLGRSATRTFRRPSIIISGQSNSYGEGASGDGVLTPFGNQVGGAGCYFFKDNGSTNLFTLRTKAAEYTKFGGWEAMADQISALSTNAGWGATNDCIYESFGKNGINIGQYNFGSVPGIASTNWFTAQNTLEQELYGNTLKPSAIFIVGGESDGGNGAYGTSLETLRSNYTQFLNPINGDTVGIPILFSQHSAYASGTTPENLAMLTNHETIASNFLVMPKYQLSYGSDHIHLDQTGYQRMGEQYGLVQFRLMTNGYWEPLRPTAVTLTANTQITCTYTGLYSKLVLDTNSFWWLTNKANYGFTYSDNGGPSATISSVALQGNNQVLVNLSASVAGQTGRTLSYGVNSTTNSIYCAGTTFTPGGNVRDDNPIVGFRSGSNLWNWSVVFTKPL